MKKIRTFLCLALILVSLFALVSCSTFNSVKSNFEKMFFFCLFISKNRCFLK